ncbi:hypothetical protein GCM10023091_31100 [Ravibacter arvi]|uniref:Uncharacterized protein n=1 Tax=Ravibacter arvi TaxID=2051041 RepID=A0ABP8M2B5_9BACT
MKSPITFTVLLLFAFFACRREVVVCPDTAIPDSSDTTLQRNFRLVFVNLREQWKGPENLVAHVTVESPRTPEKPVFLTVPVRFENLCSTPVISLPKGAYRIKALTITDNSGVTRLATPVAGSPKAGQSGTPLSVSLTLDTKTEKEIRLEVLSVGATDTAASFGYPPGSFGKNPDNPQPPMDKRVFIRSLIRVGEIVYDSIPVQLIVKSWDAKEVMDYRIHYLAAGTQSVYLSAKAERFHLSVKKWGSYSELTLSQAEVEENAVYDLGGQVAAKKLKSVIESRIAGGTTTPQTKTDYEYHPNGEIRQRLIWGKKPDLSSYVVQKDVFAYTNNYITTIQSYNESNALVRTLTAHYGLPGRVTLLEETKGSARITATAAYVPLETHSGRTRDYRIDVAYRLGNGIDYYAKTMRGGAVVSDVYRGHTGGLEEGTYDYDFSINPYVHLHIPDLFFTQYARHNMVVSRKIRTGAYPQEEPYDYQYVYDADDYPKELLTKYRSTKTGADLFVIRTVFTYW